MTDRSGDDQDVAEQTDDDAIDLADYPPERPLGVEDFGTTPLEEQVGESVEQRDRREVHREDLRQPEPPTASILSPDDDFGPDLTAELVGVEGDEPDSFTAEEAAVHLVDPVPDDPDGEIPDREVPGPDAEGLPDTP